MGKRGQITIFIIIGILILLLAIGGLIIYSQQQSIPDIKTPETFEGQVRSFVESCLSQQTLSGIQLQGKQGGYIEIPPGIPTLILEDATLPYWLDQKLQIPSLDNLKQQLNDHILTNLNDCLQDFDVFKKQGFNITQKPPSLTITMENQIIVDLDYPLTFQKEGTEKTIQDFSFEIPINMNLIHQIAADLALFQNAYVYLEQHTNSMISLYGAVKHDSLPPIRASRVNFDCDFTTWNKVEVKNYLKRIIDTTLPHVNIKGTNFKPTTSNNKIAQGVYDGMTYQLFPGNFPTIEVEFRQEGEFKMDITPSKGNRIVPLVSKEGDIPLLPSICIIDYESFYDVEYSVVVTVKDQASAEIQGNTFFEEQGFTFQFPMKVIIKKNNPRVELPRTELQLDRAKILEALGQEDSDFDPTICDTVKEEVTIVVRDSETKENIDDAFITYICGDTECFLGNENPLQIPDCQIEDRLEITHRNYSKAIINNIQDQEIDLHPKKLFTIKVQKIPLDFFVQEFISLPSFSPKSLGQPLADKERAAIYLEGTQDASIIYPTQDQMELAPGEYTLRISLHAPLDIKEQPIEGVDAKLPKLLTNYWPVGSIDIPITLTQDILDKNEITFYVFTEQQQNPSWDNLGDTAIQEDLTIRYNLTGTIITIARDSYATAMQPTLK